MVVFQFQLPGGDDASGFSSVWITRAARPFTESELAEGFFGYTRLPDQDVSMGDGTSVTVRVFSTPALVPEAAVAEVSGPKPQGGVFRLKFQTSRLDGRARETDKAKFVRMLSSFRPFTR